MVLFDAVTTGIGYNLVHSCSGHHRLLLFGGHSDTYEINFSNIKYGGRDMTLMAKISRTGFPALWIYYLSNPPSGKNLLTGVDDATRRSIILLSFKGVDPNIPIINYSLNPESVSPPITYVGGNVQDTMVVDFLSKNDKTTDLNAGPNQVERAQVTGDIDSMMWASTKRVATPGVNSMTWQQQPSGNPASGSHVAILLNPRLKQLFKRFWWSPVSAGIAFDAASNSGYLSAVAEPDGVYSWNHTCTGDNRYLVVGVSMLSVAGSSVTGITYNGVALTKIGHVASVSGAVRAELWGLIAPATGSNAIQVTLSAALDSAACAVSFTGVHQTSPTEGFNTATATNVGAADATVDITTVADNDWVIDQVATDDTAISVGTGQTQRNNVTGALGSGADSTEGPKTPAGAVTMNWTDVGAAATWSIAGVAIRPIEASTLENIFAAFRNLLGVGI